jgi:hypothetical protein
VNLIEFFGSLCPCGSVEPHLPHSLGEYETVRYGRLSRFCPGMPGPGAEFRVIALGYGDPHSPSRITVVTPPDAAAPPRGRLGDYRGEEAECEAAELYARLRAHARVEAALERGRQWYEAHYGPEDERLYQTEEVRYD